MKRNLMETLTVCSQKLGEVEKIQLLAQNPPMFPFWSSEPVKAVVEEILFEHARKKSVEEGLSTVHEVFWKIFE